MIKFYVHLFSLLFFFADVDDCALGLHMCDNSTSECVDTIENYTCQCKDGYEGDGFNCSGK